MILLVSDDRDILFHRGEDGSQGKSRGFGFVQFALAADAERAIREFNKKVARVGPIAVTSLTLILPAVSRRENHSQICERKGFALSCL